MRDALVTAAILCACVGAAPAQPAPRSGPTLVLPFRPVGVSDTTLAVCRDLLEGNLTELGVTVLRVSGKGTLLPSLPGACDEAACAAAAGREHGASQVVYGSLSRLGDKVIARVWALRVDEATPFYCDQMNALTEEDLDVVMRRIAEGIAAGRGHSNMATIHSVTQDEASEPTRRATRSGIGFRAGFIFPTGSSYGGNDRLTRFRFGYKYETARYMVEMTPLAGLAWGGGTVDWTVLDLSACRIFGAGDFATYLGAGFGVHSVRVEQTVKRHYEYQGGANDYDETIDQSETAPTFDLIAGVLAFRTYDFEVVVDLRYHHTFEDFDEVGGDGAHGFQFTVGTGR